MNEICKNFNNGGDFPECAVELYYEPCDKTCPGYVPSGRVSVPVELIEAVKKLETLELRYRRTPYGVSKDTTYWRETQAIIFELTLMLTEIEKGGEG